MRKTTGGGWPGNSGCSSLPHPCRRGSKGPRTRRGKGTQWRRKDIVEYQTEHRIRTYKYWMRRRFGHSRFFSQTERKSSTPGTSRVMWYPSRWTLLRKSNLWKVHEPWGNQDNPYVFFILHTRRVRTQMSDNSSVRNLCSTRRSFWFVRHPSFVLSRSGVNTPQLSFTVSLSTLSGLRSTRHSTPPVPTVRTSCNPVCTLRGSREKFLWLWIRGGSG